jgi:hypothetical protein
MNKPGPPAQQAAQADWGAKERGAGIRDKPRTEAKAYSAYSLVTKNCIRVGAGGGENKGAGEAHGRIYRVLHIDTHLGREVSSSVEEVHI